MNFNYTNCMFKKMEFYHTHDFPSQFFFLNDSKRCKFFSFAKTLRLEYKEIGIPLAGNARRVRSEYKNSRIVAEVRRRSDRRFAVL